MLQITCPACGKQYQFAEQYAGRTAKCPGCGGALQLPHLAEPLPEAEALPSVERKTSGMAIAALCLGIAAFLSCLILFPLAIVGLILGIIAINRIDNPANGLKGRGLAQAGAIISGIGVGLGLFAIPLMIGIMLPALGAARRTARQMQNSTQIRGIDQGHILYAQGNDTWYAGLTKTGTLAPPTTGTYSAASPGVGSNAMAILLNGNYFTPGYIVSPADSNPAIRPLLGSGVVTLEHYSYAVPQVTDSPSDLGRHDEWKDNTNTLAPVLSDRVLDQGAEVPAGGVVPVAQQRSIWTTTNGDWRGSVVFGDNATQFMTTSEIPQTKYGNVMNSPDDLFVNDGSDPASNALQVRN